MAPKKSTIALNIEQFIRDVEERPAIWNRNFHCNKAFLEQMWDELSTEHKLAKAVLKAKWKGLRDNFRVEYKRIPRTDIGELMIEPATFESKWIHYYALLFLIEHMRHRTPKNEQDQTYLLTQQSEDTIEKTIVEPDLTNGLIRRLQDSDEEFDENDVEDDDIDDDNKQMHIEIVKTNTDALTTQTKSITTINNLNNYVPATTTAALMALHNAANNATTPPAAHSQSFFSSATELLIKSEEVARSLLKSSCLLQMPVHSIAEPPRAHSGSQALNLYADNSVRIEAEDLSRTCVMNLCNLNKKNMCNNLEQIGLDDNIDEVNHLIPTTTTTSSSSSLLTSSLAVTNNTNIQHQSQILKKRSVSPPTLYNKAHNLTPATVTTTSSAAAAAVALSQDVSDEYGNGRKIIDLELDIISAQDHQWKTRNTSTSHELKLKRPHVAEEPSINSTSAAKTVTLVPEDDDYHYLLSLHPYMKQLTAAQKLRTRTKIQKLIFKELFKEDLEDAK